MTRVAIPYFALTFFVCLYFIFTCTAQNSPRTVMLTPAIYNASEGNSNAVQFTCTASPSSTLNRSADGARSAIFSTCTHHNNLNFIVNRKLLSSVLKQDRGIEVCLVNSTTSVLYVLPLQVNHNSTVQCYIENPETDFSSIGVLMVQGLLSAPPALTIMNSTHPNYRLLSWTPPITLDLTDQEPDIIGYRVCFNISSLDAAAAEIYLHCILTQDISYTYPNIRLPLQFSVTPLNVVGDGNSSFAAHQPCTTGMKSKIALAISLCKNCWSLQSRILLLWRN